jgi:hypothetical protein
MGRKKQIRKGEPPAKLGSQYQQHCGTNNDKYLWTERAVSIECVRSKAISRDNYSANGCPR